MGKSQVHQEATDWRHQWRDPDGGLSLQVALIPGGTDLADRYLLSVPDQCDFLLDPQAGHIAIGSCDHLSTHTLEHLLIDQALPRLLAGQGHLMVHASLVKVNDRAVLFLGRSGWGKSTLAGLLHRHGHAALSDDCALLAIDDDLAWATPAYPGLRLYEDSIEQAFEGTADLKPVADYTDKQRVISFSLPTELLAPQLLHAVYLLCDPAHADGPPAIDVLTPAAACMALVEHSFRLDPASQADTVRLLQQAAAITLKVPAYSLCYQHDFDSQDDLINLVSNHIRHFDPEPA